VLLRKRHPISDADTTGSLTLALAELGAAAIVEALARIDELRAEPQDDSAATYAPKVSKSEARIDWTRAAVDIDRLVRAFNPIPGAETEMRGQPLKVWKAVPTDGSGAPGSVLYSRNSRLVIGCGSGALELLEIQRPGARRMAVAEFVRGTTIDEGSKLGNKPLASA
jgi:methionyl-tRNA formyltransferase